MKKFISVLLIVSVLTLNLTNVYASENISKDDKILNEVSKSVNIEQEKLKLIEFTGLRELGNNVELSYINDNKSLVVNKRGKAYQIEEIEGDQVEVTTFIPYKLTKSGDLVNSFVMSENNYNSLTTKGTSTQETNFVDIVITVKTYYAHYFSWNNMMNFYRHGGIESSWSSNNNSVSVQKLYVNYDSCGDLYDYADISNSNPSKLETDYFIRSEISEYYPSEGTTYIDGNNTMPFNRVIYCCDHFKHGGLIHIKVYYGVNGNHRMDERSYGEY